MTLGCRKAWSARTIEHTDTLSHPCAGLRKICHFNLGGLAIEKDVVRLKVPVNGIHLLVHVE